MLNLDFRFGSGEHAWSQAMIVLGPGLDNMVQYFAGRVRDIGVGTVNVTGRALKSAARSVGLEAKESDDEKKNNKKKAEKKNKRQILKVTIFSTIKFLAVLSIISNVLQACRSEHGVVVLVVFVFVLKLFGQILSLFRQN